MTARRGRVASAIGALAVYAAAVPWVFRSWFLASDGVPHAPGPLGALIDADLNLNIWILGWIAHAMVVDPTQWLDGNIFHPAPNTIAGSENMLAHLPFTAPTLAWTGSALTMLKVYVLESFALSGLGMFLYVRHHTKNGWAALAAGAAYTFTGFRVETIPQPQYLGMAFLPLALLSVDRHLEDGRFRWLLGFAAALVLQALSCVYIGFFTFLLCPLYVLARGLHADGRAVFDLRPVLKLGLAMITAAILLLPAALPYLGARSEGMIPTHDFALIRTAAWSPVLFFSREFIWRAGLVPVVVVAIDLVQRAWRRWRLQAADPTPSPTTALWLVAVAAALLAAGPDLSLGGDRLLPLPYRLAYQWVPGFASIRVPIRFVIMVAAAFAALAGLTLARWLRDRPVPIHAGTGIALTALAIWAAAPRPHAVMPSGLSGSQTAVYRWLADQPGPGAVLEIPGQSTEQDVIGNLRNSRYMVASTLHWRPLLNGYTAYPPTSAGFFSAAIRDLPERAALANLVDTSDLRWIVVHRDDLQPHEAARWTAEPFAGLERVARFGADDVFEVRLPRERPWRKTVVERMRGTMDSLEGTPRDPLPARCRRARILDVDSPRRLPRIPLARRVAVRVSNDSTCTWPANGLVSAGLVGLDYRWIPPQGMPEAGLQDIPLFRLLADVAPGREAEGAIMLSPPRGDPGPWTLEVRLVQEGEDEPLAVARRTVQVGGRVPHPPQNQPQ